jgi:hypothetical protein
VVVGTRGHVARDNPGGGSGHRTADLLRPAHQAHPFAAPRHPVRPGP